MALNKKQICSVFDFCSADFSLQVEIFLRAVKQTYCMLWKGDQTCLAETQWSFLDTFSTFIADVASFEVCCRVKQQISFSLFYANRFK